MDMDSRITRGALVRAQTATLQAGTASAILPTTGIIFNSSGRPPEKYYGLSVAAPDAFQSRINGDGYDIPADSWTLQQQQQHHHQQNVT